MIGTILRCKKLLIQFLNITLMIMMASLTLDVLWGVISRFGGSWIVSLSQTFNWKPWSFLPTGQSDWTEELARFLLIWVSLLGGALAYGAKAHLGVDYFMKKLDQKSQNLAEIVVHIIVLLFSVIVFFYGGINYCIDRFMAGQTSSALKLDIGYVYLALPVSGVFFVLFCLEGIIEKFLIDPNMELASVGSIVPGSTNTTNTTNATNATNTTNTTNTNNTNNAKLVNAKVKGDK